MTKRDLDRQREDHIPRKIQERHFQESFLLTCGLGLLKITSPFECRRLS
jgi:hypothetical protein